MLFFKQVIPAVLIVVLFAAAANVGRLDPSSGVENVQKTGRVTGWRLDVEGPLFVKVTDDSTGTSTWFASPRDRTENLELERLMLEMFLAREAQGTISVVGKKERALEGKAPEDAIPIVAVASP